MDLWEEIIPSLLASVSPVLAQAGNQLNIKLWESTSVDPKLMIYVLVVLLILILAAIYATYQYKRYKKYKEFESEMKALDLEPEHEGTLAEMVKRHSMDEPVNILLSARLFDEMASSEIKRVLASPASAKLKQEFIDKVYHIRTKTYHPDWLTASLKKAEEKTEAEDYGL